MTSDHTYTMPKVLERDPAWLSQPAPGFDFFRPTNTAKAHEVSSDGPPGARKKVAHRGTEVFVAVGNEIRWSELGLLRSAGEGHGGATRSTGDAQQEKAYRILKTSVSRPILQISVSPSGDYMVIGTDHTCHVCILPSSTHLRPQETSPLRVKTFQIGPTAHVVEHGRLVSALWHPLSPSGDTLVTVTDDACVRVWELDSDNRASFSEPALAIDLKKLANAISTQVDFSTKKYGANKSFSPDTIEMRVAAACFGGRGGEDEHGWASMTLWFAMEEGDVYALCPLLPSTWRAPATLLPTLSTSVIEKVKALSRDDGASESEKRIADQQSKWLADVDAQEPLLMPGETELDTVEVYTRPKHPGAVPKLQGPFQISPEPDLAELTDISVIAPKLDAEALYDEENEDVPVEAGLSASVVCLATSTNEVHVCLDVDGVEAQWLPNKRPRAYALDDDEDFKELVLFETIDLVDEDNGCPTFTQSPTDRYELFVTHPRGVCRMSFAPWIGLLEDELAAPSDSGVGFRLNVVLDSGSTAVEQVVDLPSSASDTNPNTALAILEPTNGCIILTTLQNTPFATILDDPTSSLTISHPPVAGYLPAPEPRAPYRAPLDFEQPSDLPRLIKAAHDRSPTTDPKAPVRFSPATLQLMTEAHRIMSTETHRLGVAAADLFRRCERMRLELREQVRKVAEIAQKVDSVTGLDEDDDEDAEGEAEDGFEGRGLTGKDKIDQRIEASREKSAELNERVEALRKKMLRLGGAQLSAKERAFGEEVGRLERSVLVLPPGTSGETKAVSKTMALSARFDAVQDLQQKLVGDVDRAVVQAAPSKKDGEGNGNALASSTGVGPGFRKQKLEQVMALLERETALVEAVMARLKTLQGV